MTVIGPRVHGYLDYLTVLVFLLAPSLLGLSGAAAVLAYLLAVVHLAMTLLTRFPMGFREVVPLALHGLVEVGVGVVLSLIGLLAFGGEAQIFYMLVGLVIVLVWLLTDYRASRSRDG
ncbi:MAG: hypothetical protein ACRD02_03115 [Acidimicrobiia bacterium]